MNSYCPRNRKDHPKNCDKTCSQIRTSILSGFIIVLGIILMPMGIPLIVIFVSEKLAILIPFIVPVFALIFILSTVFIVCLIVRSGPRLENKISKEVKSFLDTKADSFKVRGLTWTFGVIVPRLLELHMANSNESLSRKDEESERSTKPQESQLTTCPEIQPLVVMIPQNVYIINVNVDTSNRNAEHELIPAKF